MKCKCCTCCRMQVKWPSISEYLRAVLVFPWDSLTFWAFETKSSKLQTRHGAAMVVISWQLRCSQQRCPRSGSTCWTIAGHQRRGGVLCESRFRQQFVQPCDLADSSFRPCRQGCPPPSCRSTRFAAFPMRKLLLEHCVGVRRCHWSLGKGFVSRLVSKHGVFLGCIFTEAMETSNCCGFHFWKCIYLISNHTFISTTQSNLNRSQQKILKLKIISLASRMRGDASSYGSFCLQMRQVHWCIECWVESHEQPRWFCKSPAQPKKDQTGFVRGITRQQFEKS